jgi:hypothetical protein
MTIRFGMILCSRSIAEITTSTAQKKEARSASQVTPKASTEPATSAAVATSTPG